MSLRSSWTQQGAMLAAAMLVTCGAHAQPNADDTGTQGGASAGVQEVVVTAQRREEKLQDVPVAVTAFGVDQLQSRGISNIYELASLAPNVLIHTATANNK